MQVDTDRVLDPLESVASRGFSRYDVFRDWVTLMLAALQRDDDTYLDVLEGYDRGRDRDRGERNADLFATAFGELQDEMARTNRDVLGEVYEAWGMQSDEFGQHFTPHNVAAAMAEMQAVTESEPDPPVTIADPACGTGRLAILAARRHDVETFCFGQDKDLLCAKMAALNFCFFNMDGVVVWGDSLKVEQKRAWRTRNTLMGGDVVEIDPEDVPLPEAAFEADSGPDPDAQADPEERVTVATSADGGIEQSALEEWS